MKVSVCSSRGAQLGLVTSGKKADRLHMRILLIPALVLGAVALPNVAAAQERVLTVFGNDRCPDNTICVRAPERERYRIPKELRPASTSPKNQSWAVRSEATLSEGASGTGSCSGTGAGGWTGCWGEEMRKAREEARAKKEGKLPE
jgi:hypothetical protein